MSRKGRHGRVGKIVQASTRQGTQMPVLLDEFDQGDMVVIGVIDKPSPGKGRNDNQGNPRPVSEKGEGLDIAGVVIAPSFIEGDEDRGVFPDFRMALDEGHCFFHELFKYRQV